MIPAKKELDFLFFLPNFVFVFDEQKNVFSQKKEKEKSLSVKLQNIYLFN